MLTVTLVQKDLINLINGTSLGFEQFGEFDGLFDYQDQYSKFTWRTEELEKLNETELFEMYNKITWRSKK